MNKTQGRSQNRYNRRRLHDNTGQSQKNTAAHSHPFRFSVRKIKPPGGYLSHKRSIQLQSGLLKL